MIYMYRNNELNLDHLLKDRVSVSQSAIMIRKCSNSVIMVFLLILAILLSLLLCKANSSPMVSCSEKEKHALLRFKQALLDPSNRFSSWSLAQDCCEWAGVRCQNTSGRVVELHLSNDPYHSDAALGGEISPALLELPHLCFLNLSFNNFSSAPIPSFLGSMRSLTHLDLSGASLHGLIPHRLGNLSTLRQLHLGGNYGLFVDDFSWISGLSSLEYLDMSWVDLHRDVQWLHSLSLLSSLSELYLPNCLLNNMISSSVGYANITSLTVLYLPSNNFNHNIPNWLLNLTSLSSLDLSDNSLQGQIPSTIAELQSLNYLNLSVNMLTGQIPKSLAQLKHLVNVSVFSNSLSGPIPCELGNLSSLSYLYLHDNKLNGTLPKNLGLLSNLVYLSISNNSIGGMVSEVNFAKLSKLKYLDMFDTSIVFNVRRNWTPPFQLEYLWLCGCVVGPRFPAWLRTQTSLQMLMLSRVGIVGTVPNWFWKLASNIPLVYLDNNKMSGDLSHVRINSTIFVASYNRFMGQLPHLSPNVVVFCIGHNSFSGNLSSFLCQKMNGRSKLESLDVSDNALSGELGDCLSRWKSLVRLGLRSNNLSGKIPEFIGSLFSLKALHLYNNSFSGGLPLSLTNCTSLGLMDFAENKLTGNVPSWIGEMTDMLVIRLSSNEFYGDIPRQICRLSSLIVLDLADNMLSGSIPRCLNNISAMATIPRSIDDDLSTFRENRFSVLYRKVYIEYISLIIKGREWEYRSILPLVRIVDLSCNNLSGGIPTEISNLFGLVSLNLSLNRLTGRIPETIGDIECLESLDLSNNHLSGEIPESITNLTFLSHLDLSYNNLSGKIPSSTQLQSFHDADFIGNAELCGAPLSKNCTENEGPREGANPSSDQENGEIFLEIRSWFYMGAATGVVVGFWGVCLPLLCKRGWRHAYFNFLDNIKDRVYEVTALKLRWVRHHFKRYRMISLGSMSKQAQPGSEGGK